MEPVESENATSPLPPLRTLAIQAFDEVRDKVLEPIQQALPERIFHYTSPSGLLSILESGSLHASHLGYLNDASEFRYGEDLFREAVEEAMAESDIARALLRRLQAGGGEHRYPLAAVFDGYSVSFCGQDNLLSMWRAYGSSGYNIGFSTRELYDARTRAKDRGKPTLGRVIYDPHDQRTVVTNLVNGTIASCEALSSYVRRVGIEIADEDLMEVIVGNSIAAAASVICFLKHPDFREESEFRLVLSGLSVGLYEDTQFRSSEFGLIPYIQLRPEGKQSFTFRSVAIGPTQSPELSRRAVGGLLWKIGQPLANVTSSDTPLR